MPAERHVVLGLAPARAAWFREVSRWATSATIGADFLKAVSVEEVRARLAGGRAFSALLVDAASPGVDRDLVATAREAGVAVLVVDARPERDWRSMGVAAILRPDFDRADLVRALADHATPIGRVNGGVDPITAAPSIDAEPRGALVAVTGSGGAGVSTTAIALAQGLGDLDHLRERVVLADLQLDADQAMLHDAGDVVPGVLELVDAHRAAHSTPTDVRRLTFTVLERRYHLLLGLRRHRDWTALRPKAFETSLAGLRRSFDMVVADVGADVEGETECGSIEVEDRNVMARATLRTATAVLVVGRPGLSGLNAQLRTVRRLLDHGVDAARVAPLVSGAPRHPRTRAEITRGFAELLRASHPVAELASPTFIPVRRGLDDLLRDGARLPDAVVRPVTTTALALIERASADGAPLPHDEPTPVPVRPGSLGSWSEDEAAG